MHKLSKSRIMSSLQCRKRVHLEVHRKDLLEFSKATEAAFKVGHAVGDMAIRQYGKGRGNVVAYFDGDLSRAVAETRSLMNSRSDEPIFEATLEHQGVLVREDVLLPVGDDSWRVVEVKASTSVKPDWLPRATGAPRGRRCRDARSALAGT